MLDFIKRNNHFFLILLSWVIIGRFVPQAMMAIIPLTLLLFKQKNRFAEMLIGFLFILILSDSRQDELAFAKDVKDIYLLLLTVFMFFDQKHFRQRNRFFIPFIPFFAVAAFVITRSAEPDIAIKKTLSYILLYVTIPAYIVKVLNDNPRVFLKDMVQFINILLFLGFILIPIAFDKVFLAGRYSGVLGNPNGIGIFCTLYFMIFYTITVKYPDLFSKQEVRLTFALAVGSILFAVSRNSMFSIMLFLFFARFYKISYWAGFTIVIVAAISYQLLMNNLESILASLGLSEYLRADHIEDGSGRIVAWRFGWQQIQYNYLLGRGFSFDEYIFWENHEALSRLGHQGGVHSTYLALWMNTGLTGLLLFFIAFFRVIFKAAAKSYLALPILYGILFSITFEAWLMGSLNPYNIMFLILMNILYHDPHPSTEEKSLVPVL
jgi:hypothetical protein